MNQLYLKKLKIINFFKKLSLFAKIKILLIKKKIFYEVCAAQCKNCVTQSTNCLSCSLLSETSNNPPVCLSCPNGTNWNTLLTQCTPCASQCQLCPLDNQPSSCSVCATGAPRQDNPPLCDNCPIGQYWSFSQQQCLGKKKMIHFT